MTDVTQSLNCPKFPLGQVPAQPPRNAEHSFGTDGAEVSILGNSVSGTATGAVAMQALSLLADALQGANDYAQRPDATMPGGEANPVLGLLADAVALPSMATTAQRASYGEPLTNGKAANVPLLKSETADALFAALPLAGGLFRQTAKFAPNELMTAALRSAKMRNAPATIQRSFANDYPETGIGAAVGQRLAHDIDGRALSPSAIIAGRRVVGGVDEGLSASEIDRAITGLLGTTKQVPPGSLGRDVGALTLDTSGGAVGAGERLLGPCEIVPPSIRWAKSLSCAVRS